MAEAATEKVPFFLKLQRPFLPFWHKYFMPFWRWLNEHSQVELRVFLPVFGGTMLVLALIALLIPTYRPPAEPGAADLELLKQSSTPLTHSQDASERTPNAPIERRPLTQREKRDAAVNDAPEHKPLFPAPVEALEEGPARLRIPKIADDGRRPSFVYSRPFDRVDPRPRLAVVVADLGLNRLVSESAINELPPQASLIFHADDHAADWMSRARDMGHEVLLSVPMEPFDYPANDPGPGTLLSNTVPEENLKRLYNSMGTGKGYVGITTLSGSRFTSSPDQLRPVLRDVLERGLIWFDARLVSLSSAYAVGEEMGVPSVRTDFRITSDKSADAAQMILADAETSARHTGATAVLVYASPLNLKIIKEWAKTLQEKGFVLAPVTALAE
jgi:uncharacterized protein